VTLLHYRSNRYKYQYNFLLETKTKLLQRVLSVKTITEWTLEHLLEGRHYVTDTTQTDSQKMFQISNGKVQEAPKSRENNAKLLFFI
jgi:elongation factor P--beta-lysine ligase